MINSNRELLGRNHEINEERNQNANIGPNRSGAGGARQAHDLSEFVSLIVSMKFAKVCQVIKSM